MVTLLIRGMVFGLSAGMSPGPLTTLLISETLKHKTAAGCKVALAPLITDGPIIFLSFFLLTRFANFPLVLGIISIIGALYILWLGIDSIRLRHFSVEPAKRTQQSLIKGIITNVLNPHPYIFWMSVGATTMLKALEIHRLAPVLFLAGFYFCLVGAKIVLALVIGASRHYLSSTVFVILNNVLGFVLILFAAFLFYDGLLYLLN